MSAHIQVDKIPDGHIIVGYVAVVKVLDESGGTYWATRSKDINDMEGMGMAWNATKMFEDDLRSARIVQEEGDE